jgi:hypothetical protein
MISDEEDDGMDVPAGVDAVCQHESAGLRV